jgi:hypothetical protein
LPHVAVRREVVDAVFVDAVFVDAAFVRTVDAVGIGCSFQPDRSVCCALH